MKFLFWRRDDRDYPHLIEIRPMLEKYKIRRKILEVVNKSKIRYWHRVPHITLIYSFKLKKGVNNFQIAKIIRNVASRFNIKDLKFYYNGFVLKKGDNGYVLAFRIEPSQELKEFRNSLYDAIKQHIDERPDVKKFNRAGDDFWFHATVGYRISERELSRLRTILGTLKDVYVPAYPLRIPVLNKSKIAYEYDLITGRILPRAAALSKQVYSETLRAYRRQFNVEVKETRMGMRKDIWLMADTHFDHENIIKYCGRPFIDVREMNGVLLRNWNRTVGESDTVYFLGDASFGKYSKGALHWISRLNGRIVYIRGNHEKTRLGKKYHVLRYRGYEFLFVHDPKDAKSFEGWVVHGHVHNNKLKKYPFINGENKTINVSAEVVNYKPVSLNYIISLRLEKINRMETILDEPEYM